MPNNDPRVDAYIADAPAFAQPILSEVRNRVRKAWPEVEETIKWKVPFFLCEGQLLVSMAAFKAHAKVGMWGLGPKPKFIDVTTVAELPAAKAFIADVKSAAQGLASGAVRSPKSAPTRAKAKTKTAAPKKKAPGKKKAAT